MWNLTQTSNPTRLLSTETDRRPRRRTPNLARTKATSINATLCDYGEWRQLTLHFNRTLPLFHSSSRSERRQTHQSRKELRPSEDL